MRLIIGGVAYPTLDASQVRYKGTTSDPVPTCSVALKDDTSSIAITALAELLILDEHVTPNPTINLLPNPSLNPDNTGGWTPRGSGGGITISQNGGGGVVAVFANGPAGSGTIDDLAILYPATPFIAIVPGQTYVFSFYAQGASAVNLQVQGQVTFNVGSSITGTNLTVTTGTVRYSMTVVAPAGASYIQDLQIDYFATSSTNSGTITFTQVQFEPLWFPTLSYPTPWCGPAQTNCQQLPEGLWIRQYRKFGGLVTHAIARDYHGNARTWYIDASGYGWLFSLTFTANSFSNTTGSAIMTSLISSYFPASGGNSLFDTSGVLTDGTVSSMQPNWDDLRTIFDAIAAQTGFFWTVGPYWNVLYQPPGYTQMPISIIADNSATPDLVTTFPIYTWQAEMDFTQPGAAILVIGGSCNTQLTTALTNGTPVSSLAVSALPAPIVLGTVIGIGGKQLSTAAANAVGSTTLTLNGSFTPTANYGVGSSVTTFTYVALVIDPANSATYNQQALLNFGVNGNIFMRKITDSSLQSIADVTARGVAELLQYDPVRYVYHGYTNVELLVGQAIQVTSATDGLNATTLLIQQVQASWLGMNEQLQDVWEYVVDLGATNRAATSILSHIFRVTTKGSSAPNISTTALAVFERFAVTDTVSHTP